MMASFYKNMAKLVKICYEELADNKPVRSYLKTRNLTQKTIDKFFIGAFPSDLRSLLKAFKGEEAFLVKTDILYNANQSQFRYRPLIVPIMDINDNFVGITGRVIMSEEERSGRNMSKYTNTKYNKGEHLYGLNYAKQYIREKNTSIVVEGQFDVISSHQAGLYNVVGVSGTALTQWQIMLLARYGENVKMLFDNDEAGKRASEKFLKQHEQKGIKLNEIHLPSAIKDIDEYINKKLNLNEII